MSVALAANQLALSRASHLARVDLVTLVQGANTVRLSSIGVRFDGQVYEPFLARIGLLDFAINHLPAPDDLDISLNLRRGTPRDAAPRPPGGVARAR